MLNLNKIETLVDIRAFPASRKYPHFNQNNFKKWLNQANIDYVYGPLLGGRRNKSRLVQEEINEGWENQSFHNYADYTLTEDFPTGVKHLKIGRHTTDLQSRGHLVCRLLLEQKKYQYGV